MVEYNIPVETPAPQVDTSPNVPVISPDVPLPEDIAKERASKADFGLQGKVDKTYPDYYSSFVQGQEKYMRDYITNKLQEQISRQRSQAYISLSNAKEGAVTQDDVNNLIDYSNDPRSVIEDHYAQKYMNHLNWPSDNPDKTSWLNTIHAEEPGASNVWDREVNLGTEYLAKHQFLLKGEQDASLNAESQSWVGWTIDQLKGFSGLYPLIEGKPPGTSWLSLPGSQREDFMQRLWSLPYDQMKTEYNQFMSYYMAHNPNAAREFAHEMLGMSSSEKFLNNVLPIIIPGVEVSAIAGVAKSIAARNAMRTAIIQQIQSAALSVGMNPSHAAALASGNVQSSVVQRTWGTLVNLARRADPVVEAEKNLPGIFQRARADLLKNDGGDINGTNALLEELNRMEATLPGLLKGLTFPERFPALADKMPEAIDAALQAVKDRSRDISDSFLNQSPPYQHPIDRSWWSDAIIGRSATEAFGTSGEAGRWAKERGLSGHQIIGNTIRKGSPNILSPGEAAQIFNVDTGQLLDRGTLMKVEGNAVHIEQNGTGYYIIKPFPIPEDAPAMRPFYARLPEDKVPEGGVINSLLARFRTPNETQSAWNNRNRESATFVSSTLEQYAWDQAEAIRNMQPLVTGRKKWDEWERVLNAERKVYDPDTGKIGYTYKNIGELEYAYRKMLQRSPDSQEIAAYFAFKRINEFDHVLRTVSILKHKQRQGAMAHQITWHDPRLPGNVVQSPEFDAMSLPTFPRGEDSIAIVADDGSVTMKRLDSLGKHPAASPGTAPFSKAIYYADQVDQGLLKVIELHAPEQTPLSGFGGLSSNDIPRYVLAPSKMLSNKPLEWLAQLPERGGGHFVYKHRFRISQLDIRPEAVGSKTVHKLVGVTSGWHVPNTVDGNHITGLLNRVRILLQKTTPANRAAARDIVENQLGVDWSEFLSWFKPPAVRNALGQWRKGTKPRFNLTEPFRLHTATENLINKVEETELKARYKNFQDITKTSPNQKFMTEFSQERDANEIFTWDNKGTADNPMYRYEPSPLMDAIPTMNRAMNKISNTLAMDDMKIGAVSSWLQEARKYLSINDNLLNSAPLYWFHHADFIKSPLDARKIAELEVAREQIKSFMGQVSESDAVIGYWTQKLADKLYEGKVNVPLLGVREVPGLSRLVKRIDPVNLAHTLSDPTRFIRSMTFHMKMGLFAIPQILVQGQTYVNILGISGATKATQGTVAALMHQWSRMNANPNILRALGRNAEKFGWRPGEWEEAREAGLSTGFFNVGSEYALRDDPMSNQIIQSNFGKFLKLGALPFTEGERNVRFGSWYTAYKEYRDLNPTGALTNADKLKILDRAALLNGNMNRASNAMYQRGFAALPAQFLTYTIRQAELMWGKRLTASEKARLLITNAMAYGLPVGMGITGLPSDFFKNAAIEAGYNPGDNYVNTLITEGIPSTILALVDHDRYWNVGERFGNTGLNDLFYGDKTLWDLAGGAAFSSFGSFLEAFDPARQAIMSGYRQDGNQFTVSYDHLLQPLREITSFNSAERSIIAAKTGNWVSKNGSRLTGGLTIPESIMSFISGLQPQEVADLRHITDIKKAEKSVEQWAENRAIQEAGRSLESYDNKDPDQGSAYMTNAMMYLNVYIPDERREEVLTRMFDRYQDVIQRVRQSFGTKDVPPWLKDQRRTQYIQGLK